MDRDLKVFVASLILLTLVAVSAVIYTGRHIYVVRESLPPPTVTPLNAYVTGGKIYLELYFNSTLPIQPLGGEVQLPQLGENMTFSGGMLNAPFNVSFPLSPLTPPELEVTGYLRGELNGSQIYVTFSGTVPVQLVISVSLVNFSYSEGITDMIIRVDSPVNLSLTDLVNFTLVNSNLSYAVARQYTPVPVNLSLSYGVHYVDLKLSYNESGQVYVSSISPGVYYEEGEIISVLHYPVGNMTRSFSLYLLETV